MATRGTTSDHGPVDRLAEEFLARHRRGEHPAIAEYAARHPEWADEIREVFPALVLMEQLKPTPDDLAGGGPGAAAGAVRTFQRLGDYRLLREVGRGGMGVVYEAVQESLGRHVALKVLPGPGRVDAGPLGRFRLEARSAARLHHTNIVPVFDIGEHDGVYYYSMQFISGQGLDLILQDLRRLRDRAPAGGPVLDAREALSISVARAHGLQAGPPGRDHRPAR
jgi:serine/threonine protein kinase